MRDITLEELLEAGCHFGHQVTRQNPKARDYIFEARDNIHIIDLAKTKEGLDEAAEFVKSLASKENSTLLIVASKKQATQMVVDEVVRAQEAGADGLFYVSNRWIGGILTNLSEVSKNFKKLKDLSEKLVDDNEKSKYTKREVGEWEKERVKLLSLYGGISQMGAMPSAIFVVDTHFEDLAVREALRTKVTTVGITDTNADPTIIDYPIPANDDAAGSLRLIITHIMDAWIEGKKAGQALQVESAKVEGVEKVEKVEKAPKKAKAVKVVKEKKAKK
ncbi:MAG: 30S ribosomal protein S2 [Patescibacteria group bacterium]